jgi:hypothetical protein
MPVILAVHAGERPRAAEAVATLRTGGLMASERLDPLVTTLVGIMTNPTLVVTVEVAGARSPKLATIWGTPSRAVIGMTDDGQRFDLVQIEPSLLPFHLAQTTGLTPSPHPPFTGGCSMPADTLALAEDLAASDPRQAEQALVECGVPAPWADRLLIALAHRRCIWTATSVWLGGKPGRSESRLSVLDAGPAGYWLLTGGDEGQTVVVSITDFDDLMRRFAALLPGSVEI